MGLEKILCKADEAMWRGFGKVTDISEKTLGYDKYDLARASATLECGTWFGATSYMAIHYSMTGDVIATTFIGGLALLTGFMYKMRMGSIARQRSADEKDAVQGVVRAPKAKPGRVGWMALGGMVLGSCIAKYMGGSIPEDIIGSGQTYLSLWLLGGVALSASYQFQSCTDYFITQPTKPPQKSWVKKLYENLTTVLKPVPVRTK